MEVLFRILDARERRWHAKAARAAANRLTSLTESFRLEIQGLLAAEFSLTERDTTTVCHSSIDGQKLTTVVFAASAWENLASCIPDATEQLASALIRIVPQQNAPELRALLALAGISCVRPIRESQRKIVIDTRAHIVLYFSGPDFDFAQVERYYDELDSILQQEKSGEVDGSGSGVGDCHLDASLRDRQLGLQSIFRFIQQNDLQGNVRVVDGDTGFELTDPSQ